MSCRGCGRGVAISIAAHAALLLFLAYTLSFAPVRPSREPDDPGFKTYYIPPPRPAPPKIEQVPRFQPIAIGRPTISHIEVPLFPLPPQQDFTRPKSDTGPMTQAEPAPPVIEDPTPIYRGNLSYPSRALEAGKGGYVVIAFVIETDGSVSDPQLVAESPTGYGFAAAALKAFAKWKFNPKLVDGNAVAAPARIKVTFRLN